MRKAILVALVGLVGVALWHGLYRVTPGDTYLVERFGEPQRVESRPGVRLKIPLVEEARPVPKTASFHGGGEGDFLTISKEVLSLRYRTEWRVVNPETYFRATNATAHSANARIHHVATDLLRSQVVKLSPEEIGRLRDAGGTEVNVDEGPLSDALLGEVLEKANGRTRHMGIEITRWRVEVLDQRAG